MSPSSPSGLRLALDHRRIAALVAVSGPGLFGLACTGFGLVYRIDVLLGAGALLLLATLVLWTVRRHLGRRARALELGSESPRTRRWSALVAGLLGVLLLVGWELGEDRLPVKAYLGRGQFPWIDATLLGILVLAGAVVLALFARFYATTRAEVLAEARGLAAWLRAGTWLALLAGLALLLREAAPGLERVVVVIEVWVVMLVTVELLLRGLLGGPRESEAAADPIVLRLVASRWNPISSLFTFLTEAFGIDLRGSWALGFIQRSLVPLALALALLGWVSTSLTMVDPSQVGVLETFGRRAAGEPLKPGLHLTWPWPIQRVRLVPTGRIRTIPIGYRGARRGASLLWTKRHAEEEYALLLGDGRDLVAVNATLHYRVSDPVAWLYRSVDPDQELVIVADRVLMHETIGRTLDQVLSENLVLLGERIEARVQAQSDALGLGLEVVDFTILGLHPPVAVAQDYQRVVGAQIDRDTLVLKAQADRERILPGASAEARRVRAQAVAASAARLASARGAASAFEAVVQGAAAAPALFRFRRLLEAREEQLAGKPFVVLDDRLERDGALIWTREGEAFPEDF